MLILLKMKKKFCHRIKWPNFFKNVFKTSHGHSHVQGCQTQEHLWASQIVDLCHKKIKIKKSQFSEKRKTIWIKIW